MNPLHCTKCRSHNIYPERDRGFEPDPWIMVCHTCGHRIYGEENIRTLVQRQAPALVKPFMARLAALQKQAAEPVRRPSLSAVAADPSRRGKVLVHCALCGDGLWRRATEVTAGSSQRFFCSTEHMEEFKRQESDDLRERDGGLAAVAEKALPEGRRSASRKVARSSPARRGALMVHCAVCNAGVWRRPWDVKSCKSGLFFCCTEHRLQYLRSGQPLLGRGDMAEAS